MLDRLQDNLIYLHKKHTPPYKYMYVQSYVCIPIFSTFRNINHLKNKIHIPLHTSFFLLPLQQRTQTKTNEQTPNDLQAYSRSFVQLVVRWKDRPITEPRVLLFRSRAEQNMKYRFTRTRQRKNRHCSGQTHSDEEAICWLMVLLCTCLLFLVSWFHCHYVIYFVCHYVIVIVTIVLELLLSLL